MVCHPKIAGCRSQGRSGTAAVELAFILPVLTIFFLGCLDFGRFAHSYIAVINASRAGAAFGSMNPYPNAPGNPPSQPNATYIQWQKDIRQAVVDEMSQLSGFQSSNLTVTTTGISEGNGLWRVKVDVSYPFNMVINWQGILDTFNLPSSFTLRQVTIQRGIR
jgi:hypothetical protein